LEITQQAFDALLSWLNSDRELAGRRYETIRGGLVRIFVAKGFSSAEDLADEAISRVAARLSEIRQTYVGEPAAYFHGVARNLVFEELRRKEIPTDAIPFSSNQAAIHSDEYECLMRCLQFMTAQKRELILDYHVYEGADKIATHRLIAEELGISEGALRCRAHRIRVELEHCVLNCTNNLKKQNSAR
jgi:RNA polymerase sigma factor (sigma-70 family)